MNSVVIIHSLLRWAILLLGILAILKAAGGLSSKRTYTNGDNKVSLFFMICCDIQFLLGIALYFGNSWFDKLKDSNNMKVAGIRFFTVEHTAMMLLAWVLVHVGRVMVKKATTDQSKHKKTIIFFGLAILLILAAIPWPFRDSIARPLFRIG